MFPDGASVSVKQSFHLTIYYEKFICETIELKYLSESLKQKIIF